MEPIRTLGLYQPFASLMMHGKIETRWIRKGRKPPFPLGKYLIYATKKPYGLPELSQIAGNQYDRIKQIIHGTRVEYGKALCVGDLVKIIYVLPGMEKETFVDCHKTTRIKYLKTNVAPIEVHQVMIGLIFENVRRIKPFPFEHGKQGIGFLQPQDVEKIEYVN